MVNVCMRQQYAIHIRCCNRKFLVFIYIIALFHTAVDNTFFVADFEKSAAAGDLMGSA